tara:strand:+ start:29 stop:1498 length:1470 start_codon:yes stop_codon:yes gene_type:complete
MIAIAAVLGAAIVGASTESERPNILLIVSEDNGPELGCYGDPYVQTPVLDRLAESGIRFENAYVPQAGCSQSRAAFFTGLYPHQNGQIGLATWKFRMYHEDTPNMVQSLKAAGYRTGIIGKLHVNPESAFPFDFKAIPSANFGRKDLDSYARQAEQFFSSSDVPFFLSVNFPDAHRPFTPQVNGLPKSPLTAKDVKPLPYFGLDTEDLRKQTADYYNCMSRLDSLVGDLLEALRQFGKFDDTLIVYIGDHGADLLRGKRTSYEGGLRIPMIMNWGARFSREQVCEELVSTLDLAPTILEVAGADPIPELPGRSLTLLLQGEEVNWRRYLFTEFHLHSPHNFYPQRTVRDERFKLIQNLLPGEINPGADYTLSRFFETLPEVIASTPDPVRSAYHRMRQPAEFELYDLEADPYEFEDLVEDPRHAEDLHRLQRELLAWREQTHDPLLDLNNVRQLQQEVNACFTKEGPDKNRITLNYPEYFFSKKPEASE